MDHDRFDDLTRALATSPSRRQFLKILTGGAAGTMLAFLGISEAAADDLCKPQGKKCNKSKQCCVPPVAHASAICNGTCGFVCNAGYKLCNGSCIPDAECCNCTGFCDNGTCQSCVPAGQPGCSDTLPCCNGEFCFEGVCESCFTAGTRVAMADGTSRPIEHVLVGDLVLGNNGHINRVVAIERPLLGQRQLYSLNGSDFFVTAEHPFMTEAGWKSIDPAALAAEHSPLHVDRLTVGDRLLTLTNVAVAVGVGSARGEVADVQIGTVALQRLIGRADDPATPLYNLRLDGNHTYFANDLLVHNKQ